MPKETRNYVPNILATILIANYPQYYGFGHIRPAQPLGYDQIRVSASTSLELPAQASDTGVEYLRYLNPELRSNMSPPEPYIIRVPAGKAKKVLDVLRGIPQKGKATPPVAPITRIVRVVKAQSGDTVAKLAARLGVSAVEIAKFNGLLPDSQLSAGREIRIPAQPSIPDKP